MAIRTATAEWKGDLPSGSGTMGSASGALDGQYSFSSRFEEGTGSNPEELVAAAHASCFSMFLANVLAEGGHRADSVRTEARVQLLKDDKGPLITRIELVTVAKVPGVDEATFQQAVQTSKEGCPISRALGAVEKVDVDARLES